MMSSYRTDREFATIRTLISESAAELNRAEADCSAKTVAFSVERQTRLIQELRKIMDIAETWQSRMSNLPDELKVKLGPYNEAQQILEEMITAHGEHLNKLRLQHLVVDVSTWPGEKLEALTKKMRSEIMSLTAATDVEDVYRLAFLQRALPILEQEKSQRTN